jgi:hypothetical protein
MIYSVDCTITPGVSTWVSEVLALDASELARIASQRAKTGHLFCAVGQPLDALAGLRPRESLAQLGYGWTVDDGKVRRLVASQMSDAARDLRGWRVSTAVVGAEPGDQFLEGEPLRTSHEGAVWAVSSLTPTLAEIEKVLSLSEGYPPGVVAVHSGDPWRTLDSAFFALCAFDCESYVWWR